MKVDELNQLKLAIGRKATGVVDVTVRIVGGRTVGYRFAGQFAVLVVRLSHFDAVLTSLAEQRQSGDFTSTKRKRVNRLRQIHSLARRASIFRPVDLKVALSS